MTVILRPDQETIVENLRQSLRSHRRVVLVAPCGFGKTQVAAYMAKSAMAKGRSTWILVHRDYLIEQTSKTLDAHDIPHGFIASGREFNPYHRVLVCSVGTLWRRLDRLTPPDLLIPDECHHAPSKTNAAILKWASTSRHVGLTATPQRLDGRGLGDFFDAMVLGPSSAELIAAGHLSRYRAFAPSAPNMAGVHSRAGDFVPVESEAVMGTTQIFGDMIRDYRAKADGLPALYFGVSILHSEQIAATFNAAGIPALHIDGDTSSADRIAAARALASGQIKIISNCSLVSEGYDMAAQSGMDATVDCVGIMRPTQSLQLFIQMVGRAMRPKSHPAVILDHANCLMRHGLPDDERTWTLKGIDRKARQADNGPPVRMCDRCYAVFGAATRICPYCGAVLGLSPREVEEIAADLVEADAALLKAAKRREVGRAQTLDDLVALGYQRGYKNPEGWARHLIDARSQKWRKSSSPTVKDALLTSLNMRR